MRDGWAYHEDDPTFITRWHGPHVCGYVACLSETESRLVWEVALNGMIVPGARGTATSIEAAQQAADAWVAAQDWPIGVNTAERRRS